MEFLKVCYYIIWLDYIILEWQENLSFDPCFWCGWYFTRFSKRIMAFSENYAICNASEEFWFQIQTSWFGGICLLFFPEKVGSNTTRLVLMHSDELQLPLALLTPVNSW